MSNESNDSGRSDDRPSGKNTTGSSWCRTVSRGHSVGWTKTDGTGKTVGVGRTVSTTWSVLEDEGFTDGGGI